MNAAVERRFACKECGHVVARWISQCPECSLWATVREVAALPQAVKRISAPAQSAIARLADATYGTPPAPVEIAHDDIDDGQLTPISPVRITDVADEDLERTPTHLPSLDRVLGGGLVADSIVLIGGDPGAGKSSLVGQAIASCGKRVLYVSGEETVAQVTMRMRRLGAAHPEVWIVPSNDIDDAIKHARELAPAIMVIDSINTLVTSDVAGAPGSISQIRESISRLALFAKREHMILVIIAHVTKDGAIAGPNTLNHYVDVVLMLECHDFGSRRTLRSFKNRYWNTQELGLFDMTADGLVCVDPETDAHATSAPRYEITATLPDDASDTESGAL